MSRVYVGNLPMDIQEKDLDDIFYKYGRINDIDLKTPARPPAFGFITYNDPRDAEEAVRARDGYEIDGHRLRVEISHGRRDPVGGGGGFRGGPPMRGGVFGGRGGAGGGGNFGGRQTEWRVIVTGLPPSASWQDLKDHMRKAGDVVYTDVDNRGGGIVHFGQRDDMEYALRKLNESEFRNPFDKSFISVLPYRGDRGRASSRSRSRSRSPKRSKRRERYSSSRSRSRSRSRGRKSRSESRSRSPPRKKDRDSRSPERSPPRKKDRDDRGDRDERRERDEDRRDDRDADTNGNGDARSDSGERERGGKGDKGRDGSDAERGMEAPKANVDSDHDD